jgi:hypothetical protein
MALASLKANESALIAQSSTSEDTEDMEDLAELEDYLAALELEMKLEKENATFHRFLDLPVELRGLVYEHIAYDTTIRVRQVANWKHWPAICFASHQTYDEALSIVYRCAAFEATVAHFDFSQIIRFTESLPQICLQALRCNNRLTIFFGDLCGIMYKQPIEVYCSIKPWLSLCWSLAAGGNDVRWYYRVVMPPAFKRWFPVYMLSNKLHCDYNELSEVYAMLGTERMKDEVARMLLTLRTFARYFDLVQMTAGG